MTFDQYEEKFAALSQREKVLIFASGMVVVLAVLVFLLIEPGIKENGKTGVTLNGCVTLV